MKYDRIEDLLVEFDEYGFAPTITMPNAEEKAIEWRNELKKEIKTLINKVQELEDKIENGTLIELPLPIGADTWMVFNWHNKKLARVEKKKFTLTGYDLHWGENEFATKEEAEAKLKELQNGKTN